MPETNLERIDFQGRFYSYLIWFALCYFKELIFKYLEEKKLKLKTSVAKRQQELSCKIVYYFNNN